MGCTQSIAGGYNAQHLLSFRKPSFDDRTKVEPRRESLKELASEGDLRDKYNINEEDVIGSGQFATVLSCCELKNGKDCAVKIIKISKTSEERLEQEINILRSIKGHPNIVGLFDVYVTLEEVQLVMERVCGGELFDYLVQNGPYSEAAAVHHMRRMLSAVEYLHRHNIVHRDLKPENLLLTCQDPRFAELKVADFGLARLFGEETMRTVCGTWAYCAPEVRNGESGYGSKVDIWSCGVIMYVLLVAFHPFDPLGTSVEDDMWYQAERANFDFSDPAWECVSSEAKDLITKMIVLNAEERLSAEDVLAHPFLTGSDHSHVPLSPRINIDLDQTHQKFRRRVAGAGKAVLASVAFANAVKQHEPPELKLSPKGVSISLK